MENTVGSRFYKNEQERDKQVKEKITKMLEKLNSSSIQEKQQALVKVNFFFDKTI